ncbi:ABC transporter substrate-binding protein [Castellaniella caeni]|uniref:ABC transporter substrate-binding protein n=1 Tax=Castellaniella caeni TaxID=266123 RepID=UPI00082D40C0|nr:ABC transporter substrate-binding protein [Castellaniella caeni]
MKFKMRALCAGALGCLLFGSVAAHATNIEVLHWWTSGGEAKAAAQLKSIMESKGYTWKDFAVAGGGGENAMTVLKTRVVSGDPPAAAQIKGPSIQEWGAEGVLADLSPVANVEKWDRMLPEVVADVMKYDGHYVAVPVNVHRVNWMWINPAVFKAAGADVPRTWDEFPEAAKKIRAAGYIPLAHGGQPWQDFTVFESVVLGVGGADFYRQAMVKLDQKALHSDTMRHAFEVFGSLRADIDPDAPNRDWNQATAMVINGKAAMQLMGDWAKGEFTQAGKMPGKDYECVAAPGSQNAFTFNIDSLVMFQQNDANVTKGQHALASAVLSPAFQKVFNLAKGSIPVRTDMDLSDFDACARKSARDFQAAAKAGTLVPSIAHQMAVPAATAGAMQDVVTQFFNAPGASVDNVLDRLAQAARIQ